MSGPSDRAPAASLLPPVPPLLTRTAFETALREATEILQRSPPSGSPEALRFDQLLRRIAEFRPLDPPMEATVSEALERRLRALGGRHPGDDHPWSPMVGGDLRRP